MTAPTKNRVAVDAVSNRNPSGQQMSSAERNELAVGRATQLHNEIFAKGVLPAL